MRGSGSAGWRTRGTWGRRGPASPRSVGAPSGAMAGPVTGVPPVELEQRVLWPWQGVDFSLAFVSFLAYVFLQTSYLLPTAQPGALAAVLALTFGARDRWRFAPSLGWMAAFLLVTTLSYRASQYANPSWEPLQELAKLLVILWIATSVLRDRARLRFFLFFYLGLLAAFPVRGIIFNKYIYGADTQGRYAWNGAFANPNDMAAFMLVPIGIAAALLVTERARLVRLAAALGLVVLPVSILFTQSRGAMLALGSAFAAFVVLENRHRGRTLLLVGAVAVTGAIFAPKTVWTRFGNLLQVRSTRSEDLRAADDQGSAEQRLEIMKVALRITQDFPITGVGWGAYNLAHANYARRNEFAQTARGLRDAHSTYLSLAAETGLVGALLWLSGVFTAVLLALRGLRDIRDRSPGHALQIKYVLLGFLAFALSGVFGSYTDVVPTYLYLAVLIGLGTVARQEARLAPGPLAASPGHARARVARTA